MPEINYLFSTLLMGLGLLAIGWTLTRMRGWQRYSPAGAAGAGGYAFGSPPDRESLVERAMRSPVAWIVAFVLLALGFGGGTLLFVSGSTFVEGVARPAGLALGAIAVVLLGFYLLVGVYRAAMGHGMKSAQAAAVSAWLFGTLVLVVVAVRLVLAG